MNKNKLHASFVMLPIVIGLVFVVSSCSPAKAPAQKAMAEKAAPGQKGLPVLPAKKALSKGMGGLTVKVVNSKNIPSPLMVRAFRSVDSRSSALQATFIANSTQELSPGTYDIELSSTPQRIYKGVRISEGRDTVEDLGCLTGSLSVKALNAKKKAAAYPVKVLQSGTRTTAGVLIANRVLEIAPGIYDIEIGVMPMLVKKNIRVDAAKEATVDIGCVTGELLVKAADENKKERKFTVRVKKAGTKEIVATGATNRPIEVAEGIYDVEIASAPPQSNNGVNIKSR
jgi:hypothetical protein